ncbi:MAG: HK97 gp10 family phage protein [Nitrospinae bacterium]|nr:HK97 gp10 family phage protein [Nitrospinota bacterium]
MLRRYESFEALVEAPPTAREEAEVFRLAREAMAEVTEMLRREVVVRTPVGASGNLKGSIFTEIKGEGRGAIRGVVASRADYADHVEFGRRPGGAMPPWREGSPLYRWVVRNLESRSGEFESVAFLVARAIARRGTRGRRMFARSFEENQRRIEGRIRELLDEIVRRVGG